MDILLNKQVRVKVSVNSAEVKTDNTYLDYTSRHMFIKKHGYTKVKRTLFTIFGLTIQYTVHTQIEVFFNGLD